MARNFIKDKDGKDIKNSKGERLFWTPNDGDSNPKHKQTVYSENKGFFGGSRKNKATYDP